MFFEVDAARTLFSVQSNLQQQRPAQTLHLSGCLSRLFLLTAGAAAIRPGLRLDTARSGRPPPGNQTEEPVRMVAPCSMQLRMCRQAPSIQKRNALGKE